MFFLGYPPGYKGYKLLELATNKIFVSRNVVFHEEVFPFHSLPHSAEFPLYLPHCTPTPLIPFSDSTPASPSSSSNPSSSVPQRHFPIIFPSPHNSTRGRILKPPSYLNDCICGSVQTTCKYPLHHYLTYKNLPPTVASFGESIITIPELHTYAQASKLDALHANNTWSIVHLPHGKTSIGCKWIYRIKFNSDGSVERYKARLVAHGFT